MSTDVSLSRRQSLALLVKLMLLVALLAFVWVIMASFTVNTQDAEQIPDYYVELDVSTLQPGGLRKERAGHKEVWIYRRSESDLQRLKQQVVALRSVDDEFFVFFPYEPVRHCQVQWHAQQRSFYDPCSANHFDLTGRVLSEQGQPVYLPTPQHRYSAAGYLLIDVREAPIR
ncbi:MAG: hypothetical protein PVF81_01230 [Thioalkalispiraceae bacterium]|jgi:Rieske Fe-S protein